MTVKSFRFKNTPEDQARAAAMLENERLAHGYASSTVNPYTTYAEKTAAIVRLEADNAALLAQVRTLRAQLEDRESDLAFEFAACQAAEQVVAQLRAELAAVTFDLQCAEGRRATAERALAQAEARVVYLIANDAAPLDSSADELNDTGLTNRETDAALRAYANGATTIYTPVGERLVLDKLTY